MPREREKTEEVEVCPECGSKHLVRDYDRGELVCDECGAVLDDQFIDQGPEWRAFDVEQGEKRARTGAPMTYTIQRHPTHGTHPVWYVFVDSQLLCACAYLKGAKALIAYLKGEPTK